MPKYHWQARTAAGQAVSGDLEARSKEDVQSRLRSQSLAVVSIEEKRSGGEPEDPDRLNRAPVMPAAPTNHDRPKPRRFLAVVCAVLLLAAAVAVFKIAILFSIILGGIGVLFLLMAIFTKQLYEVAESAEKRRKSHQL